MDISTLSLVYFSPTGGSRKTAWAIAQGIPASRVNSIDLTLPQGRADSHSFSSRELVVFSLPVYGGRLPLPAVEALERFQGQQTPAILAAVYGNRAYEDALLEMKDLLSAQGFLPIAAGAFIAQHPKSPLVGADRPNQSDLAVLSAFGRKAASLLEEELPKNPILTVPGNFPYKERAANVPLAPETSDLCVGCGACVKVCPTAAIPAQNPRFSDPEKCILCQACEKACPAGARKFTAEPVVRMAKWLEDNCQNPLPNEVFFLAKD